MKQVIVKSMLIASITLLSVPSVFAQKEKAKKETEKNVRQSIVITRKGDLNEKTVVEIDGSKIKVNGKDVKDSKDVSVEVNIFKGGYGSGSYSIDGVPKSFYNFNWNDNGIPDLFSEDENRAMLGVTTETNDKGAEILSVVKESAAEKAGFKKGDVITKIGDKKIETAEDVTKTIRNYRPGDKISITYLREGKQQTATAGLTKWKGVRMNAIILPQLQGFQRQLQDFDRQQRMQQRMFGQNYAFGRPRLGLSIQDTDDGAGVKVLDVDEESAAAKAGIKKDDIIVGVDDTDVKSTDDVLKATRPGVEKFSYKFKVKRGGATETIEVKIPRKLKTADL